MKALAQLKLRLRLGLSLAALVAGIYTASVALAPAADTAAGKKAEPKADAKPAKKSEKKKLTGAELYAIHCGRCHPERYATEFNASQWKTIVFEMRVRANLPAKQAQEILKYLQEDAGK